MNGKWHRYRDCPGFAHVGSINYWAEKVCRRFSRKAQPEFMERWKKQAKEAELFDIATDSDIEANIDETPQAASSSIEQAGQPRQQQDGQDDDDYFYMLAEMIEMEKDGIQVVWLRGLSLKTAKEQLLKRKRELPQAASSNIEPAKQPSQQQDGQDDDDYFDMLVEMIEMEEDGIKVVWQGGLSLKTAKAQLLKRKRNGPTTNDDNVLDERVTDIIDAEVSEEDNNEEGNERKRARPEEYDDEVLEEWPTDTINAEEPEEEIDEGGNFEGWLAAAIDAETAEEKIDKDGKLEGWFTAAMEAEEPEVGIDGYSKLEGRFIAVIEAEEPDGSTEEEALPNSTAGSSTDQCTQKEQQQKQQQKEGQHFTLTRGQDGAGAQEKQHDEGQQVALIMGHDGVGEQPEHRTTSKLDQQTTEAWTCEPCQEEDVAECPCDKCGVRVCIYCCDKQTCRHCLATEAAAAVDATPTGDAQASLLSENLRNRIAKNKRIALSRQAAVKRNAKIARIQVDRIRESREAAMKRKPRSRRSTRPRPR